MTPKEKLLLGIERKVTLRELSRLYANYVLATFGGNKTYASRAREVNRRTIQRWERSPVVLPAESTKQLSVPGVS
jgi:hypothetical protein